MKVHIPLQAKIEKGTKRPKECLRDISDPFELCNLVSAMSEKKKYKQIKINVEFYDSD